MSGETSGASGGWGFLSDVVSAAGSVLTERERSRNAGSNASPATAAAIPDRPQPANPADSVAVRAGDGGFLAGLPMWARYTLGGSVALLLVALAVKQFRS